MSKAEKYIDLVDAIKKDHGWTRAVVESILEWLDRHPDQVPGRTITRSAFEDAVDRNFVPLATRRAEKLLSELRITVVPDPETTNPETLADDIREVDFGRNLGAGVLAERLASLGWVKAPEAGGDDDE